jgi:hypothetical protein
VREVHENPRRNERAVGLGAQFAPCIQHSPRTQVTLFKYHAGIARSCKEHSTSRQEARARMARTPAVKFRTEPFWKLKKNVPFFQKRSQQFTGDCSHPARMHGCLEGHIGDVSTLQHASPANTLIRRHPLPPNTEVHMGTPHTTARSPMRWKSAQRRGLHYFRSSHVTYIADS